MRKIVRGLLLTLALGLFITGCSSEPKVSLEQQAQNYFTLYGNCDATPLKDMGNLIVEGEKYTEEIAQKDIDQMIESEIKALDEMFEVTATDEERAQFKIDLLSAIRRVQPKIEIVSEEKDSAVVRYTISGIDMNDVKNRIEAFAMESVENDPTISDNMESYYPTFLKETGKIFNEANFITEPQVYEIEFEKLQNVWYIKNSDDTSKLEKSVLVE